MESILKLCLACGEEKPLDEFAPSRGRKDGRYSYCRKCGYNPQGPRIGLEKRRAERARQRALYVPPPTKICTKCHAEKPLEAFHRCPSTKDRRNTRCAECENAIGREQARLAREERERLAGPQDPNTKVCPCCGVRKGLGAFYTSRHTPTGRNSHCKDCICRRSKERYRADPEYRSKLVNRRKHYYAENREKCASARLKWIAENRERHCAIVKRRNEKRKMHPEHRVESCVKGMIQLALKDGKERKGWREQLGYTFTELKRRLESQFTEGMTWDLLCRRKIEIDHIIPRAAFYYETPRDPDFAECWALSNLQPLWRKDNRAKGDKMPDGSSGRKIGKKKRELYEYRLAQMAAGGTSELAPISV